jgi:hypothetical protein
MTATGLLHAELDLINRLSSRSSLSLDPLIEVSDVEGREEVQKGEGEEQQPGPGHGGGWNGNCYERDMFFTEAGAFHRSRCFSQKQVLFTEAGAFHRSTQKQGAFHRSRCFSQKQGAFQVLEM